MVFVLSDVDDDGATLLHTPFFGDSIKIRVPLESLKKWRSTKTSMPKLCDVAMSSRCLPQVHPAFVEEHQRGMVTVALHLVHTKHSSTNAIAFGQFPPSLLTIVACKKKAIKLIPMGNITKHIKQKGNQRARHWRHLGLIGSFPHRNRTHCSRMRSIRWCHTFG